MLGAQVSSPTPPGPSACSARTSEPMVAATWWTKGASNVAASPIGSGKLVVGSGPIAPWSDSVHQL